MPPNSGSLRVAVYGAESFFGGSKTSPSVKSWGPFFQKVPLAGFGAEPQGLALSAAIKSAFKKSERKVRAALTKAPPRQYVQRQAQARQWHQQALGALPQTPPGAYGSCLPARSVRSLCATGTRSPPGPRNPALAVFLAKATASCR